MINTFLHVDEKCQNCSEFKADVEINKMYSDMESQMVDTDIHIFCKNGSVCECVEKYLKGVFNRDGTSV